ncbi:GGDEF domain-containing protein [Variovorax sp. J22G73]|uniref:GGDEF domain-containing protein n=1 Tax=unclassified Variovorax TaxID=663243 RepID=UPI0025776137|nr:MULTISPECIES: GGDEF domain-containing protein [unclassified Variovorax]MDM0010531.1 GGDEF domain-containing protein [Variovorax sp. J22R203]MDM0102886.1 GGDEF domain-containing protein [Variovorax sp. J22G73]
MVTADRLPIETVCVIDSEPRALSASERRAPQSLARQVVAQRELRRAMAGLELESVTYPLSTLWGRRSLDRRLYAAWDLHARERSPLSLLMIDLDHFKLVNDAHIHPAGDRVPVHAAAIIRDQIGHDGPPPVSGARNSASCCQAWMPGWRSDAPSNCVARSSRRPGLISK